MDEQEFEKQRKQDEMEDRIKTDANSALLKSRAFIMTVLHQDGMTRNYIFTEGLTQVEAIGLIQSSLIHDNYQMDWFRNHEQIKGYRDDDEHGNT